MLLIVALGCTRPAMKVVTSKITLLANGYDVSVIKVYGSGDIPRIEVVGDRKSLRIRRPHFRDGFWQAELQAGVMPGSVEVRVSSQGQHRNEKITLTPQLTDSGRDGTPDFLRLDTDSDRKSFRYWMTYLAEIQYFITAEFRNPEITDCSALVRYAYREALREHDAGWLSGARLPLVQASSSIDKYSYPYTPLGANVFRVRSGTYGPADRTNGAFAEFADAKTLQQFNTFFVSRDIGRAQPGDILFYRRNTLRGVTYHSMVFLGASTVKPDGEIYVVYHTGPDGTDEGEIRRLTITQLLHFPNPQWQAIAANPLFLGVYRWNILKALS